MVKCSWLYLGCFALAGFGLPGCATHDKYSFIEMGQQARAPGIPMDDVSKGGSSVSGKSKYDPSLAPKLSDGLALNYASSVATILRAHYTGARITREVSSSAQVGLALASGASAAFGFGAPLVAGLGLSSAGIPELQKIFDARGRAQTYQDAVRLIEEAEVEYLALNQNPSSDVLTQNGVTLFQRVTACVHVVEKTLAGNLPSVDDMQKATERMSEEGATQTAPGTRAFNNIPANRKVEQAAAMPVRGGVIISKADLKELITQAEQREANSSQSKAFLAIVRQINRRPTLSPEQKTEIYKAILKDAGIPNVEPDPNALNVFFQGPATPAQKEALLAAAQDK